MKKINYYRKDAFEFHKKVLNSKRNTSVKEIVSGMEEMIKQQFRNYEICFNNDSLHKLEPISISDTQKDALQDMYCFKMKVFQELLAYLTTDNRKRVSKLCPNCTINDVNSLDHYIPKSEFPEFSDNPLNLIQCCPECNNKKSTIWREDSTRKFLNLFIDDIPDYQYLYVDSQVSDGVPVMSFRIEKPQELDKELFKRIYNHYEGLNLLNRFRDKSSDAVDELSYTIRSLLNRGMSDILIKESIFENATMLQKKMGFNYWKSILMKECISNNDIYDLMKI